jgi:hypothetical protein
VKQPVTIKDKKILKTKQIDGKFNDTSSIDENITVEPFIQKL